METPNPDQILSARIKEFTQAMQMLLEQVSVLTIDSFVDGHA